MSHTLHAFDFLAAPAKAAAGGGVVAAFGDEPFLKRLVLKELRRRVVGEDADVPVAAYDCSERLPDWRDVADELATVSLFGGGKPTAGGLGTGGRFCFGEPAKAGGLCRQAARRAACWFWMSMNGRRIRGYTRRWTNRDCRSTAGRRKRRGRARTSMRRRSHRWIVAGPNRSTG